MLIVDGEGEFDREVLVLGNNFRTEYEQLLEAYNGDQCAMVLIKNVTTITTSKGDQYLRAQHYTILTKVVDKAIRAHLLQLHNKLSSVQSTFKKVNCFSFLYMIQCFFSKFTHKTFLKT